MAEWPTRGQQAPDYWDDTLHEYVDSMSRNIVVNGGSVALSDEAVEGTLVSYRVKSTTTFSFDGESSPLAAGAYTFERTASGWVYHPAGLGTAIGGPEEPAEPEGPPTQPGAATPDPTSNSIVVTVVPSTVASGYEWQIDGGPWVNGGASPTYEYPNLVTGTTHSGAVRAYNSLGAKSNSRAWGPATVDTVGLHEQLLAFEPAVYQRLSEGSREDFDAEPGTWTFTSGGGTISYDGPPLTTGATGSAKFNGVGALVKDDAGSLDSSETVTVIFSVHIPVASEYGAATVALRDKTDMYQYRANIGTGTGDQPYDLTSAGSTHVLAYVKGPGTGTDGYAVYRDGTLYGSEWGNPRWNLERNNTTFEIHNSPFALDVGFVFATTEVLSAGQILAIAQAAGTVGNPR